MGVGVTLANSVLDFILRGDIPAFLSLHTAEPDPDAATPNLYEVTGLGYGREALTPADWAPAGDGLIESVNPVIFAPAGASWGTITYVGVYDALTAGNLLWWGPLGLPRVVTSGDTIAFPVGNLTGRVP